jgi:hypothetical protein
VIDNEVNVYVNVTAQISINVQRGHFKSSHKFSDRQITHQDKTRPFTNQISGFFGTVEYVFLFVVSQVIEIFLRIHVQGLLVESVVQFYIPQKVILLSYKTPNHLFKYYPQVEFKFN